MRKRSYLFYPWLFVLIGLIAFAAAGDREEYAVEDALMAAEAWLELVDNGQYGESWDNSSEYFKNQITREHFKQLLNRIRKPYGEILSREAKLKKYMTSLRGAPDGEYVVIKFLTSFQNGESTIETVTPMIDKDGQWRVAGYFIKICTQLK